MKKEWLITSFEPFAGRSDNNSQTVSNEIELLVKTWKEPESSFNFHFFTLPVEYDRCYDVLKAEINRIEKAGIKLEGILSLGEGAEEFKIETQANNVDDVGMLSDNAGVTRINQVIFKDLSPDATIPFRFPFEAWGRIRSSNNPGYYICNHLCARMAYEYASDPKAAFFGFIHVPRSGQGGVFTADVCGAMIANGFIKLV